MQNTANAENKKPVGKNMHFVKLQQYSTSYVSEGEGILYCNDH